MSPRNNDTHSIFGLYESKVTKHDNVLKEATPFSEFEGMGGQEQFDKIKAGEEDIKAMRSPKYGEGAQKMYRMGEDEAKRAIYAMGKAIIADFKKHPNNTFPGDRKAFQEHVKGLLGTVIKKADGKPLYPPSFAGHIARNIINALEEVNAIQETGKTVRRGNVAPEQIVAAIPDVADLFAAEPTGGATETSSPGASPFKKKEKPKVKAE